MTKQFCDVCGKQIYGDHKFKIAFATNVQELDVCDTCQKEFIKSRTDADSSTYRRIKDRS